MKRFATCFCPECACSAEGQCRYPALTTNDRLLCEECLQICNDLPGRRENS